MTRGKLELCKLPVEIGDVIGQAIEMATPLLVRGEHALRRHGASEPLLVDGDRMRLAQVVSNLLANAARYTPPHGAIDVSCARDGDTVVITVADNGPGIPAGLLPRIFERFVQGEQRFDRANGGLGLGLALVKNLVVMHGGTVAVCNRETGGSEFTVRLPMLAASAIPVAQDDSPTARTIGSTPRRRILVVDDNEDAAELLAELLGAMGHEVVVAYDGPQALAALATFVPEVGFLDLGLPGMDGFELARQLRARVTAAPLRLVAVTGYGQDRDREASAAAGFDAHLTKPVSLSDIARLVAVAPP